MRARTTLVVVFAAFFGLGGLVLGVTMVHAAAPPLSPTVVLSIPWGSDVGQVGYRVLQEDGWQGPSTFAVTEDSIYIVDRLNSRLQVFGFDGQVRQVIPLVPDIAEHPYEIEVIGKAVYVAHYDIDQAPGISVLRNGSWHEVRLERLVSGFDGWLHLSRTQEGNLAVRRDVPPEEDTPGVPRWVILNAADALVGQRGLESQVVV